LKEADFRRRSPRVKSRNTASDGSTRHRWTIRITTIGTFLPYTIGQTARYVITPIALLAIRELFANPQRSSKKFMACDFYLCLACLWMVSVKINSPELFGTASNAWALGASYLVGRVYVRDYQSAKYFVQLLKHVAIALVAIALLDTLTGRFLTHDLMTSLFHITEPARAQPKELHRSFFGVTVLRAEGTFPHPILFGTFCTIAATIFVFCSEGGALKLASLWVCVIGCLVSISSAPFLGLVIAVSLYYYDRLTFPSRQRWRMLYAGGAVAVCGAFAVSNNPITWIFRHLTTDPADGYYRLLIWQNALLHIKLSPVMGADPISWSRNQILGDSIDCVWLVLALTYGLPAVALILVATASACGVLGHKKGMSPIDSQLMHYRTGFSVVLFLFALIGLTVHYWDQIWMFWGLCIGIRVSLEEYCIGQSREREPTRARMTSVHLRAGSPVSRPGSQGSHR
jgi:hypothetical protein